MPYKKDFTHHNKRRKRDHDYCAPWKYHFTIEKDPSAPAFSQLRIDSVTPDGVSIDLFPIGKIIENAIWEIPLHNQDIKVISYIIMPDHIHIIIQVLNQLENSVGNDIRGFKTGIANKWRKAVNDTSAKIFLPDFNDRIIFNHRSLKDVIAYVKQNPYRLAVRRCRSEFFRKERYIFIEGREMQAYGNLFHLRNPFKYALIVHRNDDDVIFNKKLQDCLYHAANGGIVVSAFISHREKIIRRHVEEAGGKIILVSDRPLEDKAKPARHDFDLCSEGRLLVVSPIDYLSLSKSEHPPRVQCLDMNSFAEKIAANPPLV